MKKLILLTSGVLLTGLLISAAIAADSPATTEPVSRNGEVVVQDGVGTVPQAQLELQQKREEARKRREEMLKVRAATIEAAGQGNTGGSKSPQ